MSFAAPYTAGAALLGPIIQMPAVRCQTRSKWPPAPEFIRSPRILDTLSFHFSGARPIFVVFCSLFCPKYPVPVKIILSDFLFLHTLRAINTGTVFYKNLNFGQKKLNVLFILSGQTEKLHKKGAMPPGTAPFLCCFCFGRGYTKPHSFLTIPII